MECVCIGLEHSIDLLSCDATTVQNVHDVYLNPKPPVSAVDLVARDHAKLHDDFIESLLQEQKRLQQQKHLTIASRGDETETSGSSRIPSLLKTASSDSTASSPKSGLPPIGEITTLTPRKRRSVKIARRSPRRSPRRQVLPLPGTFANTTPMDDTFSIPDDASLLTHFTQRTLAEPPFYIHDHCRLQKDKNKGDAVGSEVCAVGRAACLEKLRQKMELLTQVATGKLDASKGNDTRKQKKPSASMKRRKAKVSEETPTYTETRSVIELKMGFLSMQYGVLLRWDTAKTGKIVMVVLRKMCAESFYSKECVRKREAIPEMKVWPFSWTDNHAIWTQRDATEVSLLEPPYLIAPAPEVQPVALTISVLQLADFDPSATWCVLFTINGESHKIVHRHGQTTTKSLDWELPAKTVELDLEISLTEQKRSRNKRGRGKQIYPLHLLVDGDGDKLSILTPCGVIHLRIRHESEYCHWLRQELEARGREPELPVCTAVPEIAYDHDVAEDSYWNFCGVW